MIQTNECMLPGRHMPHSVETRQNDISTKKQQWIKPFLIFLFFLIGLTATHAQNLQGGISGKVNMVDGQPLRAISVSLPEADRQTLTDDEGNYHFANLNAGSYTVKLQILGAKEVRLPAEVKAGETTILDYQLTRENIQAIQEVVIMKNTNRFSKKKAGL
ncbi:carboxypeptidase-like regulatory domain-containing protein [Chryseobacterium sp. 1B4]